MNSAEGFNPHGERLMPCWHCHYFVGMLYKGTAAACSLPGGTKVRAIPLRGCSAWVREVGVDDESEAPRDLT
jgi:hypothetical protein